MPSAPTIIRKNPAFFVFKFLTLVVVFSLMYAFFIYGTDFDTNLNESYTFFQTLEIGLITLLFITCIETFYCIILLLRWTHETYEIHFDEIIYRHGLFTIREQRFSLKNIENIFYKQTLWGRILRYGSIELQGRFLNTSIVFQGISDASYHVDLIKNYTILSSAELKP